MKRPALAAAAACLIAALGGCPSSSARKEVVVYCALDRLYAEPILKQFTAETGIEVLPKWDTEATKTTGLVQAIRAEQQRPRCDVFWNNEIGQTIGLARDGLLAEYASPAAEGLPAWARDPDGRWAGFAARARVIIVNTNRVPAAERPTSIRDLADPTWKGQAGLAKPLFGTTATHVAALFAQLGADQAKALLASFKANDVVVCAGNSDVKDRVAQGELAWGLTDTDDANLALLAGKPVTVVFPDQDDGGLGTLLIPNTVGVIQGAQHEVHARALVDYLLSPEVEATLAQARSAQVPLRGGTARASWIPDVIRTPDVTWADVADAFTAAREYVETTFLAE